MRPKRRADRSHRPWRQRGGQTLRLTGQIIDLVAPGQLLPTPTTQPDTGNGHARNLGKEARQIGDRTSQLSVGGKPCEEPPLPMEEA